MAGLYRLLFPKPVASICRYRLEFLFHLDSVVDAHVGPAFQFTERSTRRHDAHFIIKKSHGAMSFNLLTSFVFL